MAWRWAARSRSSASPRRSDFNVAAGLHRSTHSRCPEPAEGQARGSDFNLANAGQRAIKYGQSLLDISDEMDVVFDKARYDADRRKDLDLAGTHGIAEIMQAERLDAILFPGPTGAAIAARPGYPTIIVPFGRVPNAPTSAFPAGFDAQPAPFGVSFTGVSCSEPRLIELAYAFEQATKRRVPPVLK